MLSNCALGLLRVSWTARRSNQSILKEIKPEYSLAGLMLKHQYFGHLMWRIDSLEKTLMLGKIEGRRKSRWQRMRWSYGITDSMNMSLSRIRETVNDREYAAFHGVAKSQTQLSEWTTITNAFWKLSIFMRLSCFLNHHLLNFGIFSPLVDHSIFEIEMIWSIKAIKGFLVHSSKLSKFYSIHVWLWLQATNITTWLPVQSFIISLTWYHGGKTPSSLILYHI